MGVADSKCFKLMSRDYTNETGKSFSFGGPGGRCGQTANRVSRIVLANLSIQAAIVSYSVLNP
ncbi:hypothetical protein YC2023_064393 [Brassica napus]